MLVYIVFTPIIEGISRYLEHSTVKYHMAFMCPVTLKKGHNRYKNIHQAPGKSKRTKGHLRGNMSTKLNQIYIKRKCAFSKMSKISGLLSITLTILTLFTCATVITLLGFSAVYLLAVCFCYINCLITSTEECGTEYSVYSLFLH